MADLGVLANSKSLKDTWERTYDPLTYAGGTVAFPLRQDAVISGETRVAGVLTPGVEVHAIWRPTMVSIKKTYSGPAGTYQFTGLAASTTEYVVYFKDPPGGVAYNDIVYALIATPP